MMLILAALISHPLNAWSPFPPPPFRVGPCKSYSVNSSLRVRVVSYISESGSNVSLNSMIFGFSIRSDGHFYYRLDNETGQYLGADPAGETQNLPIWFFGLRQGTHFIRYGLVSKQTSNISYGQICFTTKPGQIKRFYPSEIAPQ